MVCEIYLICSYVATEFLLEESSDTKEDDHNKKYWSRGQQVLYGMYFKMSATYSSRGTLANAVAMEFVRKHMLINYNALFSMYMCYKLYWFDGFC